MSEIVSGNTGRGVGSEIEKNQKSIKDVLSNKLPLGTEENSADQYGWSDGAGGFIHQFSSVICWELIPGDVIPWTSDLPMLRPSRLRQTIWKSWLACIEMVRGYGSVVLATTSRCRRDVSGIFWFSYSNMQSLIQ